MDICNGSSFKHKLYEFSVGNCGHSLSSALIIGLNDFDYKVIQYFLVDNLYWFNKVKHDNSMHIIYIDGRRQVVGNKRFKARVHQETVHSTSRKYSTLWKSIIQMNETPEDQKLIEI